MNLAISPSDSGPTRRSSLVLAVLAGSQLLVVVDATIVHVALTPIRLDLGVGPAQLQWVVTAYTLAFGGFLLLGGRIADRFGRRRVFACGAAAFAVGSVLAAVAASLPLLVTARLAQGLAAAVLAPTALALLMDSFPVGRSRQRALSVWAAVNAGGTTIGLVCGGLVSELLSWRWVFWLSFLVAACAAAGAMWLPDRGRTESTRIDILGAAVGTAAMVATVALLAGGPDAGWTSPTSLLSAAVVLAATIFFAMGRRRALGSLIPVTLLRSPAAMTADLIGFLYGAGIYAMFFVVALVLGGLLDFGPVLTGAAFLPFAVAVAAGTKIARALHPRRISRSGLVTLAMTVTAAGLGMLALLSPGAGYADTVLPALLACGGGLGLCIVVLTEAAVAGVDRTERGGASAVFNAAQQLGGALGVAAITAAGAAAIAAEDPDPATRFAVESATGGWAVGFVAIAAAMVLAVLLARRLLATPARSPMPSREPGR